MGLFENNFPYTNFHELNIDWVLQKMKECVAKVDGIPEAIADELAKSDAIKEIIAILLENKTAIRVFETFADLKSDSTILPDTVCFCKSYYRKGDVCNGFYQIMSGSPEDVRDVAIQGGLFARAMCDKHNLPMAWLGVVGSGVNDDMTEIWSRFQEIISAITPEPGIYDSISKGCKLIFDNGLFPLFGRLHITENTEICGQGNAPQISSLYNTGTTFLVRGSDSGFLISGFDANNQPVSGYPIADLDSRKYRAENCYLHDFSLYGDPQNVPVLPLAGLVAPLLKVERVTITGCQVGVYLDGSWCSRLSEVTIIAKGYGVVVLDSSAGTRVDNCVINSNSANNVSAYKDYWGIGVFGDVTENYGSACVMCYSTNQLEICNCGLENANFGVAANSIKTLRIEQCDFEWVNCGMFFNSATRATVENCVMWNPEPKQFMWLFNSFASLDACRIAPNKLLGTFTGSGLTVKNSYINNTDDEELPGVILYNSRCGQEIAVANFIDTSQATFEVMDCGVALKRTYFTCASSSADVVLGMTWRLWNEPHVVLGKNDGTTRIARVISSGGTAKLYFLNSATAMKKSDLASFNYIAGLEPFMVNRLFQ